jgi:mono/diheme cytochrome c family protein
VFCDEGITMRCGISYDACRSGAKEASLARSSKWTADDEHRCARAMIRGNKALRAGVAAGVLAVTGLGLGVLLHTAGLVDWRGERASAQTIALGEGVYAEHCAACHGRNLEGQPNWQTPLPSGRLPAPPHDASGHTWHHPDEVLFEITRLGSAAVVGSGYESDMPGFDGILTDDEIRAVLAYIKSTWPERERAYQQQRTRAWQAQN